MEIDGQVSRAFPAELSPLSSLFFFLPLFSFYPRLQMTWKKLKKMKKQKKKKTKKKKGEKEREREREKEEEGKRRRSGGEESLNRAPLEYGRNYRGRLMSRCARAMRETVLRTVLPLFLLSILLRQLLIVPVEKTTNSFCETGHVSILLIRVRARKLVIKPRDLVSTALMSLRILSLPSLPLSRRHGFTSRAQRFKSRPRRPKSSNLSYICCNPLSFSAINAPKTKRKQTGIKWEVNMKMKMKRKIEIFKEDGQECEYKSQKILFSLDPREIHR